MIGKFIIIFCICDIAAFQKRECSVFTCSSIHIFQSNLRVHNAKFGNNLVLKGEIVEKCYQNLHKNAQQFLYFYFAE